MSLNFQNFESVNTNNDQSAFTADRGNLVQGAPVQEQPTKKSNFLSFEYYQQFFDVETDQVVKRIINSVIPTHKNYITDFVQPIPDLWGPFWVSVTLVFAIGVFGNLAQFIENDGAKGEYGSDFRMVTSAATLIFLYVVIVPLLLFALTWYRRAELQYPYVDLVCLYGYSIAIFVPVSLLWIVDLNWFRWALILVSVGLSGGVLARAIWPSLQTDPNKGIAFGTIATVLLLHFLLAFSFKEYYFDAMHPKAPSVPVVVPTEAPIPPVNITQPVVSKDQKAPEAPAQHAVVDDKITKKEKRNSSEADVKPVKPSELPVTEETPTTTKKAASDKSTTSSPQKKPDEKKKESTKKQDEKKEVTPVKVEVTTASSSTKTKKTN